MTVLNATLPLYLFHRVIWRVVITIQLLPEDHRIPMEERIARSLALCTRSTPSWDDDDNPKWSYRQGQQQFSIRITVARSSPYRSCSTIDLRHLPPIRLTGFTLLHCIKPLHDDDLHQQGHLTGQLQYPIQIQ
jgi:hypothetical protein